MEIAEIEQLESLIRKLGNDIPLTNYEHEIMEKLLGVISRLKKDSKTLTQI